MSLSDNLQKMLKSLNLYEHEILKIDESTKEIEFFVIIDYSYEFLDVANYEFEKYLKERCFFYYDKAIHTRLSLAPTVRVEYSNFGEGKEEYFVSFPNEDMDYKSEEEIKNKFVDLTSAFINRVLKEELGIT